MSDEQIIESMTAAMDKWHSPFQSDWRNEDAMADVLAALRADGLTVARLEHRGWDRKRNQRGRAIIDVEAGQRLGLFGEHDRAEVWSPLYRIVEDA